MGNHFYGTAYEEHYEKNLKDFTFTDWVITALWGIIIIGAIVMGFKDQWGVMTILVGIAVIMMDVMLRCVIKKKSKVLIIFDLIGVAVIIGGMITLLENVKLLIAFAVALYIVVCFGVGILCMTLAVKKNKKIKMYSLLVEALCETVDVKRINLFKFDDRVDDQYNHPLNDNELYKPAFHYFVNGEEYFTASNVYYGDLNKDYIEGKRVVLRVNPNNPSEILPKNESAAMETLMGVSWLVIGVICSLVIGILLAAGIL